MRKRVTLQVVTFVAILAIVLPLAFSAQTISVADSTYNSSERPIVFNLQIGQTVNGWLFYDSGPNTPSSWYNIVTPNGDGTTEATAEGVHYGGEGKNGTFTFTAKVAGEWSIHVCTSYKPYGGFLRYSYTVSPAPILGLHPMFLIGLVVAVGVILELIVFLGYKVKS
jgi:hypothetical protein